MMVTGPAESAGMTTPVLGINQFVLHSLIKFIEIVHIPLHVCVALVSQEPPAITVNVIVAGPVTMLDWIYLWD